MSILWDPLFAAPFLVGLALAPAIGLLGCCLRLGGHWLATLGYAHLAGGGAVAGSAVGLPILPAAIGACAIASAARAVFPRAGNESYAVMILIGWCAAVLIAANQPRAELIARTALDGNLLFAGWRELCYMLVLVAAVTWTIRRWSSRLIRQRFQAAGDRAGRAPAWPLPVGFEVLVVAAVSIACMAVGVMATFALVLIPAWIAWQFACGWKRTLIIAATVAAAAYVVAFVLAIIADQPTGPVLVATLLAMAVVRGRPRLTVPGPGRAGAFSRPARGNPIDPR